MGWRFQRRVGLAPAACSCWGRSLCQPQARTEVSKCRGKCLVPHVQHLCSTPLRPPTPSPHHPPPLPLSTAHAPCCDSPGSRTDRILHHLAAQGALDFKVEATAPTYFALDLDGSSTQNDAGALVGQAGPYVVKVVGPDDRGTVQTGTKFKSCEAEASVNCYVSTTDMFTLKPSSECATALP